MLKNLGILEIKSYIPLGHGSLLLDFVKEVEPGKYATGHKNFTYSESFFRSHFKDDPNVPSAVMIDAMSQMLLMTFLTLKGNEGKITACLKIDEVEFKRKIVPGERLCMEARLKSYSRGVAQGSVMGWVDSMCADSILCDEENVCPPPPLNAIETKEFACRANFTIVIPEIIQGVIPKFKKAKE